MAEKVIHSPSPPYMVVCDISKPTPGGRLISMALKIN